nr:unnamed protein product [Digitaria exilis]
MDRRFICLRPSSKPSLPRPLSLFGLSSPAAASASSPFALHLPSRLLLASSAATPSSSASSTTTVAAQNPNPFNLNINLLPWLHELRFPRNFLCQPQPRPSPPPPSPPPPPPEAVVPRTRRLPSLRVTMEYDIEESVFANKEGAALQQLFSRPVLGLITKHFSVLYDIEERNTLLSSGAVRLRASHDAKSTEFLLSYVVMYLSLIYQLQQGEISVITRLGGPLYKLELSSLVPYSGPCSDSRLPRWRSTAQRMTSSSMINA